MPIPQINLDPKTIEALNELKFLDPNFERHILIFLELRKKKPSIYVQAINKLYSL